MTLTVHTHSAKCSNIKSYIIIIRSHTIVTAPGISRKKKTIETNGNKQSCPSYVQRINAENRMKIMDSFVVFAWRNACTRSAGDTHSTS